MSSKLQKQLFVWTKLIIFSSLLTSSSFSVVSQKTFRQNLSTEFLIGFQNRSFQKVYRTAQFWGVFLDDSKETVAQVIARLQKWVGYCCIGAGNKRKNCSYILYNGSRTGDSGATENYWTFHYHFTSVTRCDQFEKRRG